MIDFNMFKDVESDYFMPHCIFCVKNYLYFDNIIKDVLSAKMKKHGILSLMFTMLNMWRGNLVTKEKVKEAYEQKLKKNRDWSGQNQSIHDELESFLFKDRPFILTFRHGLKLDITVRKRFGQM